MKNKETNLEEVKNIALTLLHIDPEPTEFLFNIHPFITEFIRPFKINGEIKYININKNKEYYKKTLEEFTERINKAEKVDYIFILMHKPYRPLYFKMISKYLSEKDYNEWLQEVWTGTENPNQDPNVSISKWISFFNKANKKLLMTEEDYNVYNSLPDNEPLIIYRGVGKGREPFGLSWTKNTNTAEWFAKRWQNDCPYMFRAKCYKKDVLAYFNVRGEDELVVNVKNIFDVERIDLNGEHKETENS